MDDFLEQVARRRHQGVFTLMYVLMWVVIVISGFSALMYLMNIMGCLLYTSLEMAAFTRSMTNPTAFTAGSFF